MSGIYTPSCCVFIFTWLLVLWEYAYRLLMVSLPMLLNACLYKLQNGYKQDHPCANQRSCVQII